MVNLYKPEEDQNHNKLDFYVKKSHRKEALKSILQGILLLIFIPLYVLGTYHSCTKHKDDSDLLRYTPMAIYRGIEFFWHDDFAGVNWEERLRDDALVCFNTLTKCYSENLDLDDFNTKVSEFSKRISKYPEEKKEPLKHVSQSYIKYANSFRKDIEKAIQATSQESPFHLHYSYRTQELEDQICKMFHPEDCINLRNTLKLAVDEVNNQVNTSIEKGDVNIATIKERASVYYRIVETNMNAALFKTYRKLFGESLNDRFLLEFK